MACVTVYVCGRGDGRDRRSQEAKATQDQGGNTTVKSNKKNTATHILARLKRDAATDNKIAQIYKS
jgi:hypothetical protein